MDNKAIQISILKKYGVAVLHMRQQLEERRLGLVLGAGVSRSIGFSDWGSLIKEIAKHRQIRGSRILQQTKNKTIATQLLYQKFKDNYLQPSKITNRTNYTRYGDIGVRQKWKKAVGEILYQGIPKAFEELEKNDKYIRQLIEIIKRCGVMTVNYNFDDTIEKFLAKYRDTGDEKKKYTRGFTVVWDANVQSEKRPNIIYHPNGYLPRRIEMHSSEQLIFSEDTFEDQLIDSFAGHYNALANHYSSTTCLFVGVSLEDRTLKHMLRQNEKKCSGHIHYHIHYIEDTCLRDQTEYNKYMDAYTRANFETYNLYSMFLTSEEIARLAELITMDAAEFNELADSADIYISRQYYVVGSVAVGKSTTINQLKCLRTFDEWLEDMPEDMEKYPERVDVDGISIIDKWVATQVYKKNRHLDTIKTNGGINLIDRSPIDAFAFTLDTDKWKDKATLLLSEIGKKTAPRLVDGVFIFLKGDKVELYRRSIKKFRDYTESELEEQQKYFEYLLYGVSALGGQVITVEVTNKTIAQVTKEVAYEIFFGEYNPFDIQKVIETVKKKGYSFYA